MIKIKYWFLIVIALLLGGVILIFRPVRVPDEKECLIATGIVTHIFEGGENDVNFRLKGHDCTFYINRCLEIGLDIESLRYELTGKEVVIKYPDYWTPLDPKNKIRHLSKLQLGDKVIYSKLDKEEDK